MAIKFSQLKILIVEDNQTMRELVNNVLEGLGVGRVLYASEGGHGFKVQEVENCDIIIADWEMEPMNGIDFTRKIRTDPYSPSKMIPIILLTGYAAPKRIKEARDAGITEYLMKPFTAESLTQRLLHVINKPRDFIEAPNFVGPDRRRRDDPVFKGPYKRASDSGDLIDMQ